MTTVEHKNSSIIANDRRALLGEMDTAAYHNSISPDVLNLLQTPDFQRRILDRYPDEPPPVIRLRVREDGSVRILLEERGWELIHPSQGNSNGDVNPHIQAIIEKTQTAYGKLQTPPSPRPLTGRRISDHHPQYNFVRENPDLEDLRTEIRQLKEALYAAREGKVTDDTALGKASRLDETVTAQEARLKEQQAEIARLETELRRAAKQATKVGRLERDLSNTKAQQEDLQTKIAELESNRDASLREFAALEDELAGVKNEKDQVQRKLERATEALESAQAGITTSHQERDEVQQELQKLKSEHKNLTTQFTVVTKNIKSLEDERDAALRRASDAETKAARLSDELAQEKKTNLELFLDNQNKSFEITRLQKEIQQLSEQQGKHEELIEKLSLLNAKLQEVVDASAATLEKNMAVLEEALEDNNELGETVADLETENDALIRGSEIENAELIQQIHDMHAIHRALLQECDTIAQELEENLAEQHKERESFIEHIQAITAELEHTKQENTALWTANLSSDHLQALFEQEQQAHKQALERIKTLIAEQAKQIETLEKEREAAQDEAKTLRAQLIDAQATYQAEIAKLENTFQETEAAITTEFQEGKDALRKQFKDQINRQKADAEAQVETLRKQLVDTQATYQAEIANLESTFQETEAAITTEFQEGKDALRKQFKDQINRQKADAEAQVETLRKQLADAQANLQASNNLKDEALAILKSFIEKSSSLIQDLKAKNHEKTQQVHTQQKLIDELIQELEHAQEEIADLTTLCDGINIGSELEIEELKAACQQLYNLVTEGEENSQLENEEFLKEAQDVSACIRSIIDRLKNSVHPQATSNSDTEKLKEKINELEEIIQKATEQVSDFSPVRSVEEEQSENPGDVLLGGIDGISSQISRLERQLREINESRASDTDAHEEALRARDVAHSKALQEANGAIQQQVTALEKELANSRLKLKNLETFYAKALSRQGAVAATRTRDLEAVENERDEQAKQIKLLQDQLEELHSELDTQTDNSEKLRKTQPQLLQQSFSELEARLEALEAENEAYFAEHESLRNAKSNAELGAASAKQALAIESQRIHELEATLEEKEREFSDLVDRYAKELANLQTRFDQRADFLFKSCAMQGNLAQKSALLKRTQSVPSFSSLRE